MRHQELPGVLVAEDVPDAVATEQEKLLLVARAALVNHDLGADCHDLRVLHREKSVGGVPADGRGDLI